MSKKKKFYTVWKGHNTGVFDTWESCELQIKKFKGPIFKAFNSREEAELALKEHPKNHIGKTKKFKSQLSDEQLKKIGLPNPKSICVDAAVSGNPGKMEYRGVRTTTRKELFKQGPFQEGTNNIGEFLAIVHALALLKKKNSDLLIYSDSKTAISWVKNKRCNTKLVPSEKNKELFELINRAIAWLNNNSYNTVIVKWETKAWGEIPADFGRK